MASKRTRSKDKNTAPPPIPDVEQTPVSRFARKAYLDYSMYVILDRALPHIADGLKPVQRRIGYAMSELGLSSNAKFKKSARTVGDVIGKFHPHGDSACYEAVWQPPTSSGPPSPPRLRAGEKVYGFAD